VCSSVAVAPTCRKTCACSSMSANERCCRQVTSTASSPAIGHLLVGTCQAYQNTAQHRGVSHLPWSRVVPALPHRRTHPHSALLGPRILVHGGRDLRPTPYPASELLQGLVDAIRPHCGQRHMGRSTDDQRLIPSNLKCQRITENRLHVHAKCSYRRQDGRFVSKQVGAGSHDRDLPISSFQRLLIATHSLGLSRGDYLTCEA